MAISLEAFHGVARSAIGTLCGIVIQGEGGRAAFRPGNDVVSAGKDANWAVTVAKEFGQNMP